MLASIFTGKGKERIAGIALVGLAPEHLEAKLNWLVALKLVERVDSSEDHRNSPPSQSPRYRIHPAVRDGFLAGFDRDIRQKGHEAVRLQLTAALGNAPGAAAPTDRNTLDILEEILYHTVEAGHVNDGWQLYQHRIGGCHNLIAHLNNYKRARRLTRLLMEASDAKRSQLSDSDRAVLYSDSGYCRLQLGDVRAAKDCLSRGLPISRTIRRNIKPLSTNLVHAYLLTGELNAALRTLHESLPHLPSRDHKHIVRLVAHLRACMGEFDSVTETKDVTNSVATTALQPCGTDSPPEILTLLLGRPSTIPALLNKIVQLEAAHPHGHASLADSLLNYSEFLLEHCYDQVSQLDIERAREWAIASHCKEIVCRVCRVQARIHLAAIWDTACDAVEARDAPSCRWDREFEACQHALTEALSLARDCGFGLLHIDLLMAHARCHLLQGDSARALEDLGVALDFGVPADGGSARPPLIAARDQECGFVWGIAEGMALRGRALLLQAAQFLGQNSICQSDRDAFPTNVRKLLADAESCLGESLRIWHTLRDRERGNIIFVDPMSGTEYNYRASKAYHAVDDLRMGVLTRFPLTREPVYAKSSSCVPGNESEVSILERESAFVQNVAQTLLRDEAAVRNTALATSGLVATRPKEVIILVHGIRTFASWQPIAQRVLEEIAHTKVIPIKNGYLGALRFWCPVFTRRGTIDDLRHEIENAKAANPDSKISIIAHSFGTYAVSHILFDHPGIQLHRLILSGAIIPRSYRWNHVSTQLATDVINDYGTRDIWPVLAKCLSWGYGDTGRHGFGRGAYVIDRGHDCAHSDYFNEEFVRDYWKPWFEKDAFVPSRWAEKAPPPSWFLNILAILPLQWILVLLLLFLIVVFGSRAISSMRSAEAPLPYRNSRDAVRRTVFVPLFLYRLCDYERGKLGSAVALRLARGGIAREIPGPRIGADG